MTFDSCVERTITIYQIEARIDTHIFNWFGNGTSLFEPKFHHLSLIEGLKFFSYIFNIRFYSI